MATIGQRVFGGEGAKKYLSIANEEFSRTLRWENNWNYIRLVTQMAITPNGTSDITGCRLVSGIQYTTLAGRTYNSVNTLNFFGVGHGHSSETTGTTWTYTANSGNPYYTEVSTNGLMIHRYDGVSSTTNIASGGQLLINTNTGTIQRRTIVGCDLWKPGAIGGHVTNLQCKVIDATAASLGNTDFNTFLLRDSTSTASFVAGSATLGGATQLAPLAAEGSRPWNSVVIFWNKSFPMEIYNIYVVRFY